MSDIDCDIFERMIGANTQGEPSCGGQTERQND